VTDASVATDGLSRRQLLARAGVVAGGMFVGTHVGRSDGAFAVGPRPTPPSSVQTEFDSWIDPPRGNPLRNPQPLALSRVGNVVSGELTAGHSPVAIDNGPAGELATYNGQYPGPLIRVRRGDVLNLRLRHVLPLEGVNAHGHRRGPTNLHTHGWHVSPSGNSDNPFVQIEPGAAFDYRFDLTGHRAGTTNWYHPHFHGLIGEQIWAGLAGPIIVEDGDIAPSLAPYGVPGKEFVCVLKDIEIVAGRRRPIRATICSSARRGRPSRSTGR
jgi:FtsP/CotA-like multicopper oxidase with cupredoxin domain